MKSRSILCLSLVFVLAVCMYGNAAGEGFGYAAEAFVAALTEWCPIFCEATISWSEPVETQDGGYTILGTSEGQSDIIVCANKEGECTGVLAKVSFSPAEAEAGRMQQAGYELGRTSAFILAMGRYMQLAGDADALFAEIEQIQAHWLYLNQRFGVRTTQIGETDTECSASILFYEHTATMLMQLAEDGNTLCASFEYLP